jgi:multidrug resistance efflux pump
LAQRQVGAQKAQRMSAEATLAQAKAQLCQAQVNLERTRILSPVDGYVTNLLAQLGDYVNVGVNAISLVGAEPFWVDGYFEETNLAPIRVGDPAQIKLMGHSEIVRGHVGSIARAINVSNAQPNNQGSRPSTRSSPGCASPSASRSAFISTRWRRASCCRLA